MERRKLTKADIDKVRNIEGFPIAKDEDIIALSDAPYYTACPNPFIEEFIKEKGVPYDEYNGSFSRWRLWQAAAGDGAVPEHGAFYGTGARLRGRLYPPPGAYRRVRLCGGGCLSALRP